MGDDADAAEDLFMERGALRPMGSRANSTRRMPQRVASKHDALGFGKYRMWNLDYVVTMDLDYAVWMLENRVITLGNAKDQAWFERTVPRLVRERQREEDMVRETMAAYCDEFGN
jgi:hypothetical protein